MSEFLKECSDLSKVKMDNYCLFVFNSFTGDILKRIYFMMVVFDIVHVLVVN